MHVLHSSYHEWQLVASMNMLVKPKCYLFSWNKWEAHGHICHSAIKTWSHQSRSNTHCKNTSQYSWQSSRMWFRLLSRYFTLNVNRTRIVC
jgi:hypothetical protein